MLGDWGLPQGVSAMLRIDHADHPREEWRPGVETRMLISALTGAKELCIFEQWVAPGAGTPVHAHPVEEVLTVLSGEAEMWLDDRSTIATAGQSLIVPALRKHRFRNSGTGTLHIHAVLASPVLEAQVEGREEPVRRWMLEDDAG
jgi:mannose-6-phosphate isomerase-like protein (cupin superfamily)